MLNNRYNKQAIGFTKHNERRVKQGKIRITNPKHPLYNEAQANLITTLIVRGTLDILAKRGGIASVGKKVLKEHPTDKGYYKEVYVLSAYGKLYLKQIKERLK